MAEEATFNILIPPDLEPGVYSNMMFVWHTPYEFTIDFTVTEPPRQDEQGKAVVPCRGVSRVKVPVTQLFALIRALNTNMTQYEDTFGPIQGPQAPPQEGP